MSPYTQDGARQVARSGDIAYATVQFDVSGANISTGAVVGVQPFGGDGLSGTGPKAGGPLYLHRLVKPAADTCARSTSLRTMAKQRHEHSPLTGLQAMHDWLDDDVVPHANVLHHYCT